MLQGGDRPGGLLNLRDVGDLPTLDGRWLPTGRLYRSDAPIPGDPEPPLRPWPPRTVVDLRSSGEAAAALEHPLASTATEVVSIPLFREVSPEEMAERDSVGDLSTIYRGVLRVSADRLARVVLCVADSPAPVLLHCAAGKDRTGVATALILSAVGVSPQDVVADYRRTEAALAGLPGRLAQGWSDGHRDATMQRIIVERPDLMEAPAAAIEAVLDVLDAWHGGTAGWLRDHGVDDAALARLRERLTEPTGGPTSGRRAER